MDTQHVVEIEMSLRAKFITKFRMRRSSYVAVAVDDRVNVVNVVDES